MPKRLDKPVDEYKRSVSFDMDAALARRSTFMDVYSSNEWDIKHYFLNFNLARL